MNPSDPIAPDVKNLVPVPTETASAPPAPAAGLGVVAARRSPLVPAAVAALVLLLLIFGAYKLFHHHRNQYEATADAVTRALAANDMLPVEHKFNAVLKSELEDRVRVARLSEIVAPLGKFEGSTEITPPSSAAGLHVFTEKFADGSLEEKYELDSEGKIAHFHIGPKPSPAP